MSRPADPRWARVVQVMTPASAARSPRLIDPAHREPVAALHAAPRGEGMTDSPHAGPVHQPGTPALEHAPDPPTTEHHGAAPTTLFSALNSVRRAASASRTSGRYAVGPAGRSLTPTPTPARPTSRRRTARRKINDQEQGLTGPAPSGMTCITPYITVPFVIRHPRQEGVGMVVAELRSAGVVSVITRRPR